MTASATPFMVKWFEIMDSTTPERVLDMITDDFQISILFATADGAAEFKGDRAGLETYLAQREVSVLVHHVTHGHKVGDTEVLLGETRRDGAFEASFNTSTQIDPASGKARRMLICRTPSVSFSD
ncbi:hypothetical protein [Nocardioides yefusunii]|uniref:Nuclear transport factor 2 family protein n=1 Tax=Nocardioides yefusunii TaxID=2500546 RepID=A0ABW1QTM7_9ACTN|nr:hypothetical protein [Nocardioides yefusunii]